MSRKMYRNVEKRGVQRAFRVTKRRDLYDLLATLLLPPPRQPEIGLVFLLDFGLVCLKSQYTRY